MKSYNPDKDLKMVITMAEYNLGINCRKLGDLDRSSELLSKAAAKDQKNPIVHNEHGLSLFEKKEYRAAMGAFGRAVENRPSAVHYNNRGLAYYHMADKMDEALEDFASALECDSGDPTVYYNRGNVYLSMNRFDEAIADYSEATSIKPQEPKFHHALGLTYEAKAAHLEQTLLKGEFDDESEEAMM